VEANYWQRGRHTRRNVLRGFALLAGSAALSQAASACSLGGNKQSSDDNGDLAGNQTVRYIDTEPPTMDPGKASTTGDLQIIDSVWEPLLSFDAKGDTVPQGAASWEISPDGITYTFHLRDGVKWSDGSAVTARDYEWTWKRNEDPKLASEYAQALYNLKGAQEYNAGKSTDASSIGVRALDDRTLQATLTGPAGYFLRIASTWTAMPLPQRTIDKYGDKWTDPSHVVSNGPFKLDKWKHDQQIVLVRNERYWGEKPALSKITVQITDDIQKASLPGYENGELDYAIGPWPADMDRLQKDAALSKQLHTYPNSATVFLSCDTTNSRSPVQKADVRRALSLAVDRDRIAGEVFKGVHSAAYTILPADIPGNNPNARLPGSVKEAQAALAAAGYPGGQGMPSLNLTYVQKSENDLVAQVLQQMWRDNLGVKVDLNPTERKAYAELQKSWKSGHFELTLSNWYSDYLDPFDWHNFLFKTDTDFFNTHWSNPDFDRLVTQAAVLTDQSRRRDLHQQAEAILVHDASQIPLYHPGTPYLIKPWVTGHVNDPTAIDHFTGVRVLKH
jgi:oligopeptide transport system substrate-binding protein